MLPRGRPPFVSATSGPLPLYHFDSCSDFNKYPSNYFQKFHPSNTQNTHPRYNPRRDRARPLNLISSDDTSSTSVMSTNTTGRAVKGMGRGSGLVHTPQQRGNWGPQQFNKRPPHVQREHMASNNVQSESSQQYVCYLCSQCRESYFVSHVMGKPVSRLPLVLHCGHTFCQECIYKGIKSNKIKCFKCSLESEITHRQRSICQSDLQNIFLPNYHILGVLSCKKLDGGTTVKNVESISFVSCTSKKLAQDENVPDPSDQCCFSSCCKEATIYCPSCEGIYCSNCCTMVHKSAKNLMAHQPVLRRLQEFTLSLEQCIEHPSMLVEFYCKICKTAGCCYCFLSKHDHKEYKENLGSELDVTKDPYRIELFHLTDDEMKEFKQLKKIAKKVLKNVISAQKKTLQLANFDVSTIKREIYEHFADWHAILETLEKKLCEDVDQFKTSNSDLERIQKSLKNSEKQLKELVAFDESNIGDRKLNLNLALEKLRHIEDIPSFLLNNENQTVPVRIVVDSLNNFRDYIRIETSDPVYQLVTEKELPEDYIIKDQTDSELINPIALDDDESIEMSIALRPQHFPRVRCSSEESLKYKSIHQKPKEGTRTKSDLQRVQIQHIASMDSFFIQYQKDQNKLLQLSKDIENYLKMGGAQAVDEPRQNELYLACYYNQVQENKERTWCRARVSEIRKEDKYVYEMFFIDYGRTQLVEKSKILDLPAVFSQKKPFAIECTLHNPMNVNWKENTHISLAKILNGKEICILEKARCHGILEVDLMIASSDGGIISVTDILVHGQNLANPMTDSSIERQTNFWPLLKVFPNSKKFVKNQKERVIVANVIDPYNIFVHLVQHQSAFKSMCYAIKKSFKGLSGGCIPIEGTYVLVEYRNLLCFKYHRGFIKSVHMNSEKVHVLLVDWGLNVMVPTQSIKPIEECFTKLESQAIFVKLAHIAPYNKQAIWPTVSTDFLHVYKKSQDTLKMVIQETDPELEVFLFDINGNVDVCINALMVESNLADSIGPLSTKVEWLQYDDANVEFLEADGLMSSLLKKVDEEANDESEEDNSDVVRRKIEVIKVDSPEQIWVKFLDLRDKEIQMLKALKIHYCQEQETQSEWNAGESCVTEFNSEYVRGKIVEQCEENYKIFLLDMGIDVIMPKEQIYVYDRYFTKYQQWAYKSHLANIRPAGGTGKWSLASTEALQQIFAKQKKIYGTVESQNDTDPISKSIALDIWYGVIIRGGPLDPDRLKFVSVNNSLVRLGFAFRVTVHKPVIVQATNADNLLEGITKELLQEASYSLKQEKELTAKEEGISEEGNQEIISSKDTQAGRLEENLTQVGTRSTDTFKQTDKTGAITLAEKNVGSLNTSVDQEGIGDTKKLSSNSPYRKRIVSISDWLPAFRLSESKFDARVLCVETGGYLYLRQKELDCVYYQMEANIKKFFESEPPDLPNHKWQPGQLCTIKYSDGNWYRGKILKLISPDLITVYMIDFGSDHDVSSKVLYREVLFTKVAAFATKVKLDRVYARSGSWLTSDYDNFFDLVTDWCKVIVRGSKEVELPLVDLYNIDGICVNTKLCELCPNLSRSPNFPVQGPAEDSDEVEVLTENEEIPEALAEALAATCMEEGMCEIDFLRPPENVELIKYKLLPLPEKFQMGEKVVMIIGSILSLDKITIHLPLTDSEEEMCNLTTAIQNTVLNLPPLNAFIVGVPCLALFSEDSAWYRGRIMDVKSLEAGFVNVMFVDYGNYEPVLTSNLKMISAELLEVPQQCWEATVNIQLSGVADAMTMPLMKSLDQKCKYVELVAEDPLTVDLYDNDSTLCYQTLIESGVVKVRIAKK
ncbi:RING finger protein 17 [Euwallacea fornicatus]|uniref:RING finger protein 17 n=1 Tax=Euwallacea fornicatus TaxID=995702 RepID=UPI0033900239